MTAIRPQRKRVMSQAQSRGFKVDKKKKRSPFQREPWDGYGVEVLWRIKGKGLLEKRMKQVVSWNHFKLD